MCLLARILGGVNYLTHPSIPSPLRVGFPTEGTFGFAHAISFPAAAFACQRIGNINFDIEKATLLEVEWWIVHRQRDKFSGEELGRACANAAAEVYRVSPAAALEHGRLRAGAMTICDTKAKEGGVLEEDWQKIEVLLKRCSQSLHAALRS